MEESASAKKLQPTSGKKSSARIDTRRSSRSAALLLGIFCALCNAVGLAAQGADPKSLFPPGSTGLYSGRIGWKVGDILLIDMDSEISLTVRSERSAGRMTSLELGNNATESPLAVYPPASADSDFQLDASVQRGFQGRLAVRVDRADTDGTLWVKGGRHLNLVGGLEEVRLEGRVHPSHIRAGVIALEHLADLTLTLRVPAQGSAPQEADDPQAALNSYWDQFRDALSSTESPNR